MPQRTTMAGKALATGAVLAGLFAASHRYNRFIGSIVNVAPGATALQVVGGTVYTLAGITVIVTIWQGVRSAAVFAAVAVAGFAASGYPMLVGDIRRDGR